MKVTVENKKGLEKSIKVLVDKQTINLQLEDKFEEIKKDVVLKGFRPGKVPTEILKRQFGKAVYGEVIDKILKESTTKVLEDKKIKPAGQPKIDLKTFGEGKDLEYTISVTELPKIDLKNFSQIKYDEYSVKIDPKETDKRIDQIAKTQNNFKDATDDYKSKEGDLVVFDYKASVDGKDFKGNTGNNTQIVLGKDLFIKGFDKQLIGSKKKEERKVKVKLPENFPEKDIINKEAVFNCKITSVKIPEDVKINDDFAKNLGAKDLNNLKELISKQINDEFKNSLEIITKAKILEQIEKQKIDDLPENLIDQEVKNLSRSMKEEDIKKNMKSLKDEASKRIKTSLILSAFGDEKKIQVSEQEMNSEVAKQMGMMPGQEKIVQEYYQKNPAALDSLRGSIYEQKIINEIKNTAQPTKKEITKDQAEKILKEENEKNLKNQTKFTSAVSNDDKQKKEKKAVTKNIKSTSKDSKQTSKKKKVTKKVSKK
ncbi:trigger factor [Candidatus Pelagibacter sp.]|nr:trigger factor [Candidatus Pelagibacter sp.]